MTAEPAEPITGSRGTTHGHVEQSVGGQALRERSGEPVLDRGAHMNRRGVVDLHTHTHTQLETQRNTPSVCLDAASVAAAHLMVQAHRVFGRRPDRHRPHRRRANHRRGGAGGWGPL